MGTMNGVLFVARLTKDVLLHKTDSDKRVARLRVAWSDYRKNGDDEFTESPGFIDVKLFGDNAVRASKKLSKGDLISFTGRLVMEEWEDGGKKRSKLVCLADRFRLVSQPRAAADAEDEAEDSADAEAHECASAADEVAA